MTESTDGLYEYIQSSNNANQFKIATSEDSWDYGWTYVQAGFNSTDVTNIGDYSQDNCYCWQSGDYYILVYYPNTAVNTTANPIICASTTLPGAAAEDGSVIKLTFNCYNSTSGDKGQSETKLAGLFDKASLAYVDTTAAKTLDKVYLGRKYKEGNDSIFSNLKIGSSSAAGEFKFALANPTEVDSIVFRTAMYANNEGGDGFSVNGTAFTLSAGKLAFEDKVWKPEGEVSSIDIVQTKANKGRFFLTSITIYPKSEEDPGEDPEEPVDSMTVYFYNSLGWENVNAFVWPAEGAAYKEWPGEAAKKEAEQIHGVDVYAYTFPAANVNVIFNNGAAQTANLAWDAGKPYFVPGATDESEHYTGTWYAKAEIPAFYITGNAALVGEEKQWTPGAIPSENDTLVLDLEAGKQYMLKVTLGNDWNHGVLGYDALSENPAGIIRGEGDDNDNICFTLAEAGQVKVVYIKGEGDEYTFKLIGNFYVYVPVLENGYYLVGDKYNWTPAAERLFLENIENKGEYYLEDVALAKDDSLKVVYVENDVITNWYPDGDNYVVDANHAGEKTIYFNPTYQEAWGGNIFIAENPAPKQYYAKYAPAWEWKLLTEKESLWLTDTIVYKGIGININDAAADENNMFYSNTVEEEGVRPIAGAAIEENDTVYFTFNPADSVVTAVMVGKYVAPDPTVAVVGSMNDWQAPIPFTLSEDKKSASLTVEHISADNYEFKMMINGEYRGLAGEEGPWWITRDVPSAAGMVSDIQGNMTFVADVDGEYTFVWNFEQNSLTVTYPALPEVNLEDGYYLIGLHGWNIYSLVAEEKFELQENGYEYKLTVNLAENDEFKVVEVASNAIVDGHWYPASSAGNYVVDADHAGANKDIYFRPDYQGGQDWHEGCIYVVENGATAIDNTAIDAKAEKMLKNGMILIIKGDKTYNVMGQIVK
jgi:hypothetical protein